MSESPGVTVRTKFSAMNNPSPVYRDEILDWDVPFIDAPCAATKIRVRIRDVAAEPMLDA